MKVDYLDDTLSRQNLFGLDFVVAENEEPIVDELISLVKGSQSATVVTPNVDIMVRMSKDMMGRERSIIESAEYCTPDGQPIVWASKLLGKPLGSRIAGSSIFDRLWPRIKDEGIPVTMVASSEKVADFFAHDYGNINFEIPPYIDSNDEVAMDELLVSVLKRAALNESRIILCGIGYPKDPLISDGVRKRWESYGSGPAPVVLCLGASFEMYAGLKKRAPVWMQKSGLEWFYRFTQEPKRLFNRYFVKSPRFLKLIWAEYRS